jgi:hypothetical protein
VCIIRFGLDPEARGRLSLPVYTWLIPTAMAWDRVTGGPPDKRPGRR